MDTYIHTYFLLLYIEHNILDVNTKAVDTSNIFFLLFHIFKIDANILPNRIVCNMFPDYYTPL